MTRTALLCLTIGTVLLSPVLCLGGVLEHACECENEQAACQHEDDCPGDPCSVPLSAGDPGGPGPLATSLSAWSSAALDPGRSIAPSSSAMVEVARKLPYPPSDRPLRI